MVEKPAEEVNIEDILFVDIVTAYAEIERFLIKVDIQTDVYTQSAVSVFEYSALEVSVYFLYAEQLAPIEDMLEHIAFQIHTEGNSRSFPDNTHQRFGQRRVGIEVGTYREEVIEITLFVQFVHTVVKFVESLSVKTEHSVVQQRKSDIVTYVAFLVSFLGNTYVDREIVAVFHAEFTFGEYEVDEIFVVGVFFLENRFQKFAENIGGKDKGGFFGAYP